MKIQELENELNISRANIRFYEKEGLLNPKRKENGYRNYSDDDIAILKKIIIYRKLGISVADIKKIFNGEAELQEAVSQSIENLQKEIENLNGSIKLCKEIQNNNTDKKITGKKSTAAKRMAISLLIYARIILNLKEKYYIQLQTFIYRFINTVCLITSAKSKKT